MRQFFTLFQFVANFSQKSVLIVSYRRKGLHSPNHHGLHDKIGRCLAAPSAGSLHANQMTSKPRLSSRGDVSLIVCKVMLIGSRASTGLLWLIHSYSRLIESEFIGIEYCMNRANRLAL